MSRESFAATAIVVCALAVNAWVGRSQVRAIDEMREAVQASTAAVQAVAADRPVTAKRPTSTRRVATASPKP